MLVFPEDAHEPCLAVDGESKQVKKVVVKIPMK
ncbi:MAG: YhcH/YjgK/YiaL family protein [Candidatus Cryptobacteroides sp.]|nr:YhcH/YjgK/YiaL family protein [Candidatus Cryptobacteroides sp.]